MMNKTQTRIIVGFLGIALGLRIYAWFSRANSPLDTRPSAVTGKIALPPLQPLWHHFRITDSALSKIIKQCGEAKETCEITIADCGVESRCEVLNFVQSRKLTPTTAILECVWTKGEMSITGWFLQAAGDWLCFHSSMLRAGVVS